MTRNAVEVGERYDDDVPGVSPGTSQPIGYSLGAGIYQLPAACQLVSEGDPCGAEAGFTDAANDAGTESSAP